MYIEGSFEMTLAFVINLFGLYQYSNSFEEFFIGDGNKLNLILVFFNVLLMPTFIMYYILRIQKNYVNKDENKDCCNLYNFLEDVREDSILASLFQIFFICKSAVSVVVLVCLHNYPTLQIQVLQVIVLI